MLTSDGYFVMANIFDVLPLDLSLVIDASGRLSDFANSRYIRNYSLFLYLRIFILEVKTWKRRLVGV